ncbi:MAG: HAD family hydrolase [Flavobacteriaceae bacterium]|nr:HAD family hydrolase [Flavobacteriaceae bacterium]
MKKIKVVIFDLDGTIANTLPLCIRAFRESIEPLIHRPLSDSEIIATFGPSEEGTIMALAPNHYEEGIKDYLRFYEDLHDMCPSPFDGIENILEVLRNKSVHTSMVTGKGKHSTKISLDRFGLAHFFEVVETGSPKGPRKVEAIQRILSSLKNIKSYEVIYVGDSPSDIISSRNAGVPVIAAAWAETAEKENLLKLNPNRMFDSVNKFAEWLFDRV